MKTIEQILAENVRERRERRGWSQLELAKIARLSEATINRIEKGRQVPRKDNLEAVANALGCSREDLLVSSEAPQGPSSLEELISLWMAATTDEKNLMLNFAKRTAGKSASGGLKRTKADNV